MDDEEDDDAAGGVEVDGEPVRLELAAPGAVTNSVAGSGVTGAAAAAAALAAVEGVAGVGVAGGASSSSSRSSSLSSSFGNGNEPNDEVRNARECSSCEPLLSPGAVASVLDVALETLLGARCNAADEPAVDEGVAVVGRLEARRFLLVGSDCSETG